MNEPTNVQPPCDTTPPQEEMGLGGRLANVFAGPGEVFDNVKVSPYRATNWVVPALILILVSWTCSWILFQQPAFDQQLREVATRAIDKQFAKQKIPEAQAEQAREVAEKWAVIASKVSAVAAPVFVGFGMPFFWALIIWLVGTKALHGQFGYMKAVEVAGLVGMIGVLDSVIRTLLVIVTGSLFATVGPAALIKDYDPQTFSHAVLGLVNLMTLWALALRSLGMARLSGASFAKSAVWIFGLWLVYHVATLGAGFGIQALTNR